MSTPKHKHLKYEDRFVIQEFLNLNHTFSAIAVRIDKDRRCVSKEVYKHHSVNHVFAAHPELLPMSKSTFYRYVDIGLLNVRNIDLARKVRYRVKKEYDYTAVRPKDHAYKLGRFYSDFKDYIEHNPMASIVEIDTVIGTQGGKGGKCFLTMLKKLLGEFEFSRLFEVVLADNGTELSDPESIEISSRTGERLSFMFYCDPNSSFLE